MPSQRAENAATRRWAPRERYEQNNKEKGTKDANSNNTKGKVWARSGALPVRWKGAAPFAVGYAEKVRL